MKGEKTYNQEYSTQQGYYLDLKEKIKSIKDKQKLKQFNLMKSAIQEVLKGLL